MRAIVLLSGGVDSAVTLAYALVEGRQCIALTFAYGQRNRVELNSAKAIAEYYHVPHRQITISSWGAESSSALLSESRVPQNRTHQEIAEGGIAPTYVPARNTLFLSYALAVAEVENAFEIYFGANADDCLPYPDCRPPYFSAFQEVARYATKQAVEIRPPKIITPMIGLQKSQVIGLGKKLGVPLELTFSCYAPTVEGKQCGLCDACMLTRPLRNYE